MRRTLFTLICCLVLVAPKENQNTPTFASSDVPLTHKRIQDIQPGQWVKADNPAEEDDTEFGKDVDPATWKLLTLDAPKLDGTTARVQLLRPTFWLTLQQATVGNTLYISVPECGIQGDATLLQIDDCPPIRPRPGPGFQIVTGTFRHEAAQTLDISIEGESKPIGTTPNHPIWSVDRQAFVRADSLTVGERLQNLNGVTTVTNIIPRGSPEPVYNLEVQVKHTYYVADSGVLVHNGKPCPKIADSKEKVLRAVTPQQADEILAGNGIIKPKPAHLTTPTQHVGGTIHARNPWTSTTLSKESADFFSTHGGILQKANPIIEIDLSKINPKNILDVSNAAKAAKHLDTPFTRNAAAFHKEILINGDIPPEAILRLLTTK